VRPIDFTDSSLFDNGIPDVATEINGFHIKQKEVTDCSVLASLAVAAHFEMKNKW
jgi:hypothetical protein